MSFKKRTAYFSKHTLTTILFLFFIHMENLIILIVFFYVMYSLRALQMKSHEVFWVRLLPQQKCCKYLSLAPSISLLSFFPVLLLLLCLFNVFVLRCCFLCCLLSDQQILKSVLPLMLFHKSFLSSSASRCLVCKTIQFNLLSLLLTDLFSPSTQYL